VIENNKFGIIITCYRGDFHFTKGLLASIRYFCENVPICLILDGSFSVKKLENTYNIVKVIRKENVLDDYLRNNCFRSRFTNMVAFFESPFEYFLYIDSDAVLWGNVLENFTPFQSDFIHNIPHEPYSKNILKSQYFDNDRIFNYTESFEWENCHFFNSGIFSMKKGIFSMKEVKELHQICMSDKSLMPTDVQGLLNICVFRNFIKEKITVSEAKLQTIMSLYKKDELGKIFCFDRSGPIVKFNTLLHWAGAKPHYRQNNVFNLPMNFFRKMNLSYTKSFFYRIPGIYFRYEELKAIYYLYYKNHPKKIVKRFFRMLNK
jgi:hypothetical protein